MSDSSTFILCFVDVVEDVRFRKLSCRDVKVIHHSLINEIVGSATVKEGVFSHFIFVEKEADINAVLSIANIHDMYL